MSDYAEINNLAEYGQPISPYEPGFDHNFVPDFDRVVVSMPQLQVMTSGYGKNIEAESFPIVRRFLKEHLTMPFGTYTFADLVKYGFARLGDKWITADLYGFGKYGITAGSISQADAAYIHGSVSFALMAGSRFTYSKTGRRVDAEIGAGK